MKIAILHYSVPPVVGGVESVIGHHARLLSADGHSVRLIAARGETTNPQIPLIRVPLADSRHVRVAHVKSQLDSGKATSDFESLRDELVKELETALPGADMLIAHNVCSLNKNLALTAALHQMHASKKLPRLILWHHDLAWTTPRYLPELHDGYPWDLLKTDWGKTTQVVVSELRRDELSELMSLPGDEIHVIPNGIDMEKSHKLEAQTKDLLEKTQLLDSYPILLLPVRITPRKNIELALTTLARLKSNNLQAGLVITGPLGPHNASNAKYFESLLKLRKELGLEGSAHLLAELYSGYLSDEVIADFFHLSDALFLPSREEGFGIPLVEAAFNRLPVFCADIPPLRAIGMEDVVYFSPDENPETIAEKIAGHFITSPQSRFALRARKSFRWDSVYHEHIVPLLSP